eukprot:SAG22_NODE_1068_length_5742_cov_3.600390_2_plen_68_part_00
MRLLQGVDHPLPALATDWLATHHHEDRADWNGPGEAAEEEAGRPTESGGGGAGPSQFCRAHGGLECV